MANRVEEDGPRLLSPESFAFELDAELRRAVRSRSDVTLVVMEAGWEKDSPGATADQAVLREIAEIVGDGVRDTDLVGYADQTALGVVLVDSGFNRSAQVLDRLMSRIGQRAFAGAVRIAVGVACYPDHGIDARSLKHEARSRPFLREIFGTSAAVSSPPQTQMQLNRNADGRADSNRGGSRAES